MASAAQAYYFCYQCERIVTLNATPSPSDELTCPVCHGGFLEECDNPSTDPTSSHPSPFFAFSSAPFSRGGAGLVSSSSSSSGAFDLLRSASSPPLDADAFNPLSFLQSYIHTLVAGGADIQFVLDNSTPDASAFRLPSNLGDYFIGPGLEQLIQQLADNDPNRYGTPPASKSAVQSLPAFTISDHLLASDSAQCAVCMETFELGSEVKQMPCKHIYHPDCILPWLELHNSCPVCRFELPTDDPDYEHRMRGTPLPQSSALTGGGSDAGIAGASARAHSPVGRTVERRFRISLPWPGLFRAFGMQPEAGNNGSRGNDGSGQPSSGNQQNQPPGNETRQEDTD